MFAPRGIKKLSTNPLNDRTSNIDQMIRHKKSTNRSQDANFGIVLRQLSHKLNANPLTEGRDSTSNASKVFILAVSSRLLYKGIIHILLVFYHS